MTKTKLLSIGFFLSFFTSFGQSIDASLLELKLSNDGYPERFTSSDNGFYFTADDDELWFTDGTLEGTRIFAVPSNSLSSNIYGDIGKIVPVGSRVFFDASKNSRGDELWVSDGTDDGLVQLTDRTITFGQDGSIRDIIAFGDKIYFSLFDESLGTELWVTDGTIEGTELFKDINEGVDGSSPGNFFIFKNQLFFTAFTEEHSTELWSTDGSPEGTNLVKDIYDGSQSGFPVSFQIEFIAYNDFFYFFATDGINGFELWRSDGTNSGTELFKNINTTPGNSSSSFEMVGGVINNTLMFLADDGISGRELWISNGTEGGTEILKDIGPDSWSGIPYNSSIQFLDSQVFFYAIDYAEETGLWVSDGTASGTSFVKEVSVSNLTAFESQQSVVFFGDGPAFNGVLWKSDGTPQGTELVSEKATSTNISSHINDITTLGNKIFFAAETERNGIELWVSDGTDDGTSLFYDLDKSFGALPSLLTEVNDKVFLRANQFGTYQLAKSDGTVAGTDYLEINLDGQSIDEDSEFIEFNGKLVVSANDGVHGYEPWISDGTQEGTYMLKDINPGNGSSQYNEENVKTYTVINDRLYFMADDGVFGTELWSTDGTEEGTFRVTDIAQGIGNHFGSFPQNLVWYNGFIYFSASDGSGTALFRTTGEPSNWSRVTYLNRLASIHVINNRLVMIAETSGTTYGPHDLWVSDGTADGTQQIGSFGDGIDSNIRFLTVLNDELYFVAQYPFFGTGSPPLFGKSIYKTDGTEDGTIPLFVGSQHPINNPDIDNIFTCGQYVYFGIQESLGNSDKELWRTDGTVDGTVQVAVPNGTFDVFSDYGCFNETLFFIDSSGSGTLRVTNGNPNEQFEFTINTVNGVNFLTNSGLANLTQVDNKLFFTGNTDISGLELYVVLPLEIEASGQIADTDSDGVIDLFDKCSNTQVGLEINEVGCADNQLDDDNDGITNDVDLCPDTPKGMTVDSNGCADNQSSDNDNDGVNNLEDLCPNTGVGEVVDANGCSNAQLDDDEDGVENDIDLCPNTPTGQEVDSNGCSQSQLDDDNDGVTNDIDLCPNTISGVLVDQRGCDKIAQNAIRVLVLTPSCRGGDDGAIQVSMDTLGYSLNILVRGQGITEQFDDIPSNTTMEIGGLNAGVYTVTISIPEIAFEQNYGVSINELEEISAKREVLDSKNRKAAYKVSGSSNYTVFLNEKSLNFSFDSIEEQVIILQDLQAQNEVKVVGENGCQGEFTDTFYIGDIIQVFPTATTSEININSSLKKIAVSIYSIDGKLVSQKEYSQEKNNLDISSLKTGMYFLKLIYNDKTETVKIIKK